MASTSQGSRQESSPSFLHARTNPTFFKPITAVTILAVLAGAVYYLETDTLYKGGNNVAESLAPPSSSKFKASKLSGPLDASRGVKVLDSAVFPHLLEQAAEHPRKRKMIDLTRQPESNKLQQLVNTWTEGSYSPVHKHAHHSETFVILEGTLLFFTFEKTPARKGIAGQPLTPHCHVLGPNSRMRGIVVEEGEWHAMTAAPKSLGYEGHGIVFETSGHVYDPKVSTKILAPWAPHHDNGLNGDEQFFTDSLISLCDRKEESKLN